MRVGDRVTRSTVLTTIDENAGLELYINVPVQQAPGFKPACPCACLTTPVRRWATTQVNFVSPSVDPATQSVLVKAPLQSGSRFGTDQFVRARVVWAAEPGLTVPLVAVNRINGQYFVYVVEKGEGGTTVARQRPVQLGPIVGNDYVVLERPEGGRAADRVRRAEDRRRRAGAGDDGAGRPRRQRRHRRRRDGNVQRRLHPAPDSRDRLLAAHHSGRRDRHPDRCRSRAIRSWRRRRSA